MSRPAPLVLRLAAALSIIFGAVSIVDMAVSHVRGSLSLDFGFVGIPIGRGLLVGRRSSRSWAIALSGLGLVLIGATTGWGFYSGKFRGVAREELWSNCAPIFFALLVCAMVFFGLRSTKAKAWFSADSSNRIDGAGWTAPLVFIGMLFATASAFRVYLTETSLAGFFPIHTEFEFRDASTGSPIHSISYSSGGMIAVNGRRDPFAPRVSTGTSYSPDSGMSVEFTGFSGRPMEITFTPKGYRASEYTLNEKSPEKVILHFQPSK